MDKNHHCTIADAGWIPQALGNINRNEETEIVISGDAAKQIIHQMTDLTSRLPVMDLFNSLKRIIPIVGNIPVDPNMIAPLLASIGAMGGAAGSVAFVMGVGIAHGMKLSFHYDMGSLLDPMDDVLTVTLSPAPK